MTDHDAALQPVCSPKCWEPVRCPEHGIFMPPAGRSEPDGMPNCSHQHDRVNTCHLWGPHDSSRIYNDPVGWAQHVDTCAQCRTDVYDDDPDQLARLGLTPTTPNQEQ